MSSMNVQVCWQVLVVSKRLNFDLFAVNVTCNNKHVDTFVFMLQPGVEIKYYSSIFLFCYIQLSLTKLIFIFV